MKETAVLMAKANGVRWYRHVLRRDDGHVLRKALEFGDRKEEARMIEDNMENANGEGEQECWFEGGGCIESSARWRVGVVEIAAIKTRIKIGIELKPTLNTCQGN